MDVAFSSPKPANGCLTIATPNVAERLSFVDDLGIFGLQVEEIGLETSLRLRDHLPMTYTPCHAEYRNI